MNNKVAAFTVSKKSINITVFIRSVVYLVNKLDVVRRMARMNKSQIVNLSVTFLEILVAPEMPLTLMFCLTAITCGNKLTFIIGEKYGLNLVKQESKFQFTQNVVATELSCHYFCC